jgi:hypothetical protein
MPDNEESPFKSWRSVAPRKRGWQRRPAVVKVKVEKKPKPPALKNGPVEWDRFGYRVGSPAALINAVLAEQPLPVEAIARETGLPETKVSAHLRELIRRGHVEVSCRGFAFKESGGA